MQRYRFYTADVFTDRQFGGNPLAVFPDARGLTDEQMQLLAREFNLSETVFALPPDDPAHTRRLRIFTPSAEVAFAGHPTIGTAHILAAVGEVVPTGDVTHIVFEEGVGPVGVAIRWRQGRPVFAQLSVAKLPELGPPPPDAEAVAKAVSLRESDLLLGDYRPEAWSCGLPFLFVALRDRDALRRARIDRQLWERTLASYWAPQPFLFSFDPELAGSHLRARMFAPALGIVEDPATGSAAAALAGYLSQRRSVSTALRWVIEQGFEMGRPSILEVEVDAVESRITAVRVGGSSVMVCEGSLTL